MSLDPIPFFQNVFFNHSSHFFDLKENISYRWQTLNMAQKGLYWYKSVWNFKLPDIKDTAAKVIPELDDNFNLDYLAPSFRRAIVPQGSAQIATKASAYYSRFIIESAEPTWEVASLEITYVSRESLFCHSNFSLLKCFKIAQEILKNILWKLIWLYIILVVIASMLYGVLRVCQIEVFNEGHDFEWDDASISQLDEEIG